MSLRGILNGFVILVCGCTSLVSTVGCDGGSEPTDPPRPVPTDFATFADDFVPTRYLWVDVNFDSSGLDPGSHPELFYEDTYVGDGSEEYPFRYIHQAVSDTAVSATPGTQINVKAGTYGDKGKSYVFSGGTYTVGRESGDPLSINFRCSGEEGAPILLYSVDGPNAAVIDGFADGDTTGFGLMLILHNNYIIIDGFEIKNCQQNIHVGGYFGSHIMIRNCYVHDAFEGDCIKINQMDHVYIQNCVIHDPGFREDGVRRQEPIDYVAVNHGHMINNEIYNCDFGMYAKGGSRDIVFWGNYVHGCRYTGIALGGFTEWPYFYNSNPDSADDPTDDQYECYNCHAFNNVVADVGMAGIECIGCIDSTAEFNTLWNCAQGDGGDAWDEPVMVRPGETSRYWHFHGTLCSIPANFTFRNNLVANTDGKMLYPMRNNDSGCGERADPSTIHVSQNLWWSQGVTLTDGDLDNHIPVLGDGDSIYDLDPQLETADLPYLRPQEGSRVLGKGLANPAVTLDFENNARGDPPDLGAFER